MRGRILAIDLGKKRIGLALSDELGITAQGLPTLERTNIREDLARLTELTSARGVTLIVMGDPLHMSGAESRQARYTREFAQRLHAATGLPIELRDERLTSVQAERLLRETGHHTRQQRTGAVDRLSAAILLESYLDAQRYSAELHGS